MAAASRASTGPSPGQRTSGNCQWGAIPNDLREMADQFRLPWRQRWRELILPGIFPYYVTGGITAAGGAWNASIVAEYVLYGKTPLVAHGLGAYITQASNNSDFARVLTGVVVMSFYVVVVNRLVWRTCMKKSVTSSILMAAIVNAATTLKAPRST